MTLESVSQSHTKNANKVPVRAANRNTSVYDRLYKATTASSKVRKEVAPVKAKNFLSRENVEPLSKVPSGKPRQSSTRRKKVTVTKLEDGTVFNRLYQKGTASSVSKRTETDTDEVKRVALKPRNHS